ncbi:MAG: hypothetical protein QM796_17185 [Chthoniobacteraceae bacterium]
MYNLSKCGLMALLVSTMVPYAMADDAVTLTVGNGNNASGTHSMAAGDNSYANSTDTFALGDGVVANARYSTAFGYGTYSNANAQFVIGEYNSIVGSPSSQHAPSSWPQTDALFIVGNGIQTGTHNAFVVRRNGATEISGTLAVTSAGFYGGNNAASAQITVDGVPVLLSGQGIWQSPTGTFGAAASQGTGTLAVGDSSTFAGVSNSAALGSGVTSSESGQVVVGRYNDTTVNTSTGVDKTKGAFVVGAGSYNATSGVTTPLNALRVTDGGAVLVHPSGDIPMTGFQSGEQP